MPPRRPVPPSVLAAWLLAAGCARPLAEGEPCPSERPAPGEVLVAEIACRAQLVPGGEGGGADLVLANHHFRAILRHPQAALTLAGLGGGTLIDAAPWGSPDRLHEVTPLVEGGWLDVDDLELQPDGVLLSGTLRALPDRRILATGRRSVAWRVDPDAPWLHVEGADGLWLHGAGPLALVDGWLADDQVVYGHDGTVEEDLGGALRLTGTSALLIAHPDEAWGERPGALQRVAGTAAEADVVEVLRGDVPVARVPVDGGVFDALVTADATAVRALADGRAPGASVAPADDLALTVGPAGSLHLRIAAHRAILRPVQVRWTSADGRAGTSRLDTDGGTLALGAGVYALQVGTRPWTTPVYTTVEIAPGAELELSVRLGPGVAPSRHVLANLSWSGGRSRGVRASEEERLRDAVAAGLAYVVVTAEDDVETGAAFADDAPWIRWDDGVTLTSPDGWRVASWPWRATTARGGHGAPVAALLSPTDALRIARGGDGADRSTRVDLAWMRALAAPITSIGAAPDFVGLGAPGEPPFVAWAPWFAWLDAGRYVRPSGTRDWLDVGDLATATQVHVDRALERGRIHAGTGAFVDLRIDGTGPGDVIPLPGSDTDVDSDGLVDTDPPVDPTVPLLRDVQLFLVRGASTIDRAALVTQGAGVVETFEVDVDPWAWDGEVVLGSWTIVVAWSSTSDAWGVSSPVWTRAPTDGVVPGPAAAR